jgi:hypothetical protein
MVRNRSCPAVSQICNYTQTLKNAKTIESGVTYFDLFVVHSDRLHREVDSDGVSVPLLIQTGLETPHDAGLAHPAVTHEHYLEQKVEGLIPHDGRRVRTGRNGGQVQSRLPVSKQKVRDTDFIRFLVKQVDD